MSLAAQRIAGIALGAAASILCSSDARADATVGNGTPASCTQAAFDQARVNGGTITFNCGAAPHTILFTTPSILGGPLVVDGGGKITLSGGNSTSLLVIIQTGIITLRNLRFIKALGPTGAIVNGESLTIEDSIFEENNSTGTGGAITNYVSLAVTRSSFIDNAAVHRGGAIENDGGTALIEDSSFDENGVTDELGVGGAISTSGVLEIANSTFTSNETTGAVTAGSEGGAALAVLEAGKVEILGTEFVDNLAFAGVGGAILSYGDLTIDETDFVGNIASGPGGAIAVMDGAAFMGMVLFSGNQSAAGGAVSNAATMSMTGATFTANGASTFGGALSNSGVLQLSYSTFEENTCGSSGGAVESSGSAEISRTIFRGNMAIFDGGALSSNGSLDVSDSFFDDNRANLSGGAFASGFADEPTFFRSTFHANESSYGGAIASRSPAGEYFQVTISDNHATFLGGGVYAADFSSPVFDYSTFAGNAADQGGAHAILCVQAEVELQNTIVQADDAGACQCTAMGASIDSKGFNLASDATCQLDAIGDQPSSDPKLGELADNGGHTPTRLPRRDSPVVDAGGGTSCPGSDQRILPRPVGAACDIGAVELQAQEGCGDADADGLVASDALFVLRSAVGAVLCEECICDSDGSGSVTASDALRVLRAAVGQSVTMSCPPC